MMEDSGKTKRSAVDTVDFRDATLHQTPGRRKVGPGGVTKRRLDT